MEAWLIAFVHLALVLVLPAVLAAAVARRWFAEEDAAVRFLAGLSCWVLQLWAAGLLAGSLGIANGWTIVAVLAAFAGAGSWLGRGAAPLAPGGAAEWVRAHPAMAAAAGGIVSLHGGILYFRGSRFFSDDYAYHLQAVASWVQQGALVHPMINMAAYYPYNPHLVKFALALPTHDPGWVWIGSLGWVALAAGAFAALAARAGSGRAWAFPAAMAVALGSKQVFWMAEKFSPTDLAGAAALLAAFPLLFPGAAAPQRTQRASLALGMLLVGFAAGTKPTMVVPGAIASAGALLAHCGARPKAWMGGEPRARLLILLGAGLATSIYWYARNLLLYGSPLFPFRILRFDGPIRPQDLRHSVMAEMIAEGKGTWRESILALMDWPMAFGWIAAAAGGLGLLALAFEFSKGRCRTRALLHSPFPWLVAAAAAMALYHPRTPFSGTTLLNPEMWIFPRYIVFAYFGFLAAGAWALGLAAQGMERRATIVAGAALLAAAGASIAWRLPAEKLLQGGGFVLVGAAVLAAASWSKPAMAWRTAAIAGVALAAIAGRTFFVPGPHMSTEKRGAPAEAFRAVVAALDDLPAGSVIAEISPRSWEYGHLFGSRFHLVPIIIGNHGQRYMPLRAEWEVRRAGGHTGQPRWGVVWPGDFEDPELLARNLRESPIDYLLVSRWDLHRIKDWPDQRDAVHASGDWEIIWTDEWSELMSRREPQRE